MGMMGIDVEQTLSISQDLAKIARRIDSLHTSVSSVKLAGNLDAKYTAGYDKSIQEVANYILEDAAKIDSFAGALQYIVDECSRTERAVMGLTSDDASAVGSAQASAEQGADKRGWWDQFVGWLSGKKADDYNATGDKASRAADLAMKKGLVQELQKEQYSPEHWANATIDERKRILQDYANAVIGIYGLKNVKSSIRWDKDATYTDNSITWGYYTHGTHTVTLNERALSDSRRRWDSYDLLETVSHELRHAYQHEAVDNPTEYKVTKETIKRWKNNFDDYISSDGTPGSYERYRAQPVEKDARDFQMTRDDKF